MPDDVPLFYPRVFAKILTVTLCAALVCCAVAVRVNGELAIRDIIGATISSLIFAYMVHLWVALGREQAS